MKRFLPFAAAASLVAAFTVPVLAADDSDKGAIRRGAEATGDAIKSGAEATGSAVKSGAEAAGHAVKKGAEATGSALGITDSDRERFAANLRDEQRVHGKVTAIDQQTGKLTLAANGTRYDFYFPPSELTNVMKGQQLAVTMRFALPDQPLAENEKYKVTHKPAAAGDQPLRSQEWMTGTVTKVNAAKGIVSIKTDEAPLKLRFAPAAVRHVKTGDKIAVQLAFEPTTHTTR